MLQITPQHRLLIATHPVDFRCGIDSLVATCRQQLEQEPFDGQLFVFRNRSATAIKLLVYDGNGFWLCHKRFSSGRIKWWPSNQEQAASIRAVELLIMLQQGNPVVAHIPADWRRLKKLPG
jgi:transposase